MAATLLKATALTAASFAPFGDVIETANHAARSINDGTCERFDDLAQVDVLAAGGRPLISIFRSLPRALPLLVKVLERHPLSSQAIIPLDAVPFLVIVAEDGDAALRARIRVFCSSGSQGVNYRRNTWHHPLIALERTCHFLVVDRGGGGENCDEFQVGEAAILVTV